MIFLLCHAHESKNKYLLLHVKIMKFRSFELMPQEHPWLECRNIYILNDNLFFYRR